MRRALAFFLIAATSLPLVLTGFVLIRFQLERARIVKELCVQRTLPATQQTCHGRCHLMKQLAAAEAQQENAPVLPRLELRSEPAVVGNTSVLINIPKASTRTFGPDGSGHFLTGFALPAEPVPWG